MTGSEVSVSIFYLAPITLAAWRSGQAAGLITALIAALTWFMVDRWSGHVYSSDLIGVWNAIVRLGFFTITVRLLAALKKALLRERASARTDITAGRDPSGPGASHPRQVPGAPL